MRSLIFVSVLAFLPVACVDRSTESSVASLEVKQLTQLDYDAVRLTIKDNATEANVIDKTEQNKSITLDATLSVGTYTIDLIYTLADEEVASTLFCSVEDQQSRVQTLVAGPNSVQVIVCTPSGDPLSADVVVEPVLKDSADSSNDDDVTEDDTSDTGAQLYAAQCADCHADDASGGFTGKPLKGDDCIICEDREAFIAKIVDTMPTQDPALCDENCATSIVNFLEAK